MSGSVEIPLRESDEVIEIPFNELPEGEEVFGDYLSDHFTTVIFRFWVFWVRKRLLFTCGLL